MVNEIDIEKLEETLTAQLEVKKSELWQRILDIKEEISTCKSMTDLDDLLYKYELRMDKLNKLNKIDFSSAFNAAKLFNKMANDLDREFGAKVDTEEHTIRFKWFGHTLSYPVILLSKKYNFHSGMFSFESSFSTHEAYTEDNYMFKIGIDKEDCDTILIDFGNFEI